jgi:hypothetical protein
VDRFGDGEFVALITGILATRTASVTFYTGEAFTSKRSQECFYKRLNGILREDLPLRPGDPERILFANFQALLDDSLRVRLKDEGNLGELPLSIVSNVVLYRGQWVSERELGEYRKTPGHHIRWLTFISMSESESVARSFINSSPRSGLRRVLFFLSTAYGRPSVQLVSKFQDEKEVLLFSGSIVRVDSFIDGDPARIYCTDTWREPQFLAEPTPEQLAAIFAPPRTEPLVVYPAGIGPAGNVPGEIIGVSPAYYGVG